MTLGEKLIQLRTLEGFARGLGREMTQGEVAKAVREEQDGTISQSYLSQLESGARTHLTGNSRLLLARFYKVHPGHLVDDLDDLPVGRPRPRSEIDDKLDVWLIEGAEMFSEARDLSEALLKIAKHPQSQECLRDRREPRAHRPPHRGVRAAARAQAPEKAGLRTTP